jgi:hypothetical protein
MQRRANPAITAALLLAVACALAGCASGGGTAGTSLASIGGATVAFESIDGPPPHVFARMVSLLDAESKTGNLAIVSREGSASYRVRGYLSAQVHRGRTLIAWVWDVYDRDGQRALRLAGEESAGRSAREAWAAADDAVLRRIAQAGLAGLGGIVHGGALIEPLAPQNSRGNGAAIASVDDAHNTVALGFSARE